MKAVQYKNRILKDGENVVVRYKPLRFESEEELIVGKLIISEVERTDLSYISLKLLNNIEGDMIRANPRLKEFDTGNYKYYFSFRIFKDTKDLIRKDRQVQAVRAILSSEEYDIKDIPKITKVVIENYIPVKNEFFSHISIYEQKIDNNLDIKLFHYREICNTKRHPDCCGARILFHFCSSSKQEWSSYNTIISDGDILNKLRLFFNRKITAAKIAHLADYQICAKDLLNKIGFEEKYSYLNRNSGRTIAVYHGE